MRPLLLLLSALMLCCCQWSEGDQGSVERTATRWAEAYFNCDFEDALSFTIPEDGKWLRFAASNMTEDDVTLLNSQEEPAEVMVNSVDIGSDTLATAMISVSRFLSLDSIGKGSRQQENGIFLLYLVKRDGKWLVRMGGLPQSERQSPD